MWIKISLDPDQLASSKWISRNTGLDKQKFQRKIVNILLPIILAYVLGLIETDLLRTHNICFG